MRLWNGLRKAGQHEFLDLELPLNFKRKLARDVSQFSRVASARALGRPLMVFVIGLVLTLREPIGTAPSLRKWKWWAGLRQRDDLRFAKAVQAWRLTWQELNLLEETARRKHKKGWKHVAPLKKVEWEHMLREEGGY